MASIHYRYLVPSSKITPLLSIVGCIIFGLAAIFTLVDIFNIKPIIILKKDAIQDTRLSCGPIRWIDVANISVYTPNNNPLQRRHLLLELKNIDHYLGKFKWRDRMRYSIRKKFKSNSILIEFYSLENKFDQAYNYACRAWRLSRESSRQ